MAKINLSQDYLDKIVSSVVAAVPTDSIYVFGSYARGGENPESDLDLYVVLANEQTNRFEAAGAIGMALLWMGMPKDIVAGSQERFESRRTSLADLEYTVAREGIKIYG